MIDSVSQNVNELNVKPISIIIGGDLCPTDSNINLFSTSDLEKLIGKKLIETLKEADIRIFNLETPITDKKKPIKKCGPNLIAPVSTIKGIKDLNPTLLCLANNHILDQGEEGLFSTIEVLEKENIGYIGAGENLSRASKPANVEINGVKIGIYACAEHEFSIATEHSAGANPFDPLESLDHIQDLKNKCDYVIVLYHGGKEHYRYPSPYLQKVCRKIVQKGADLVICQHSHCIGCFEKYETSTIVYGQGNFIFDNSDNKYWQTGLLVKVEINSGMVINYIPITKNSNVIRLAEDKVAEKILEDFHKRSNEILQDGFIEMEYTKFAKDNMDSYLRILSGQGKWLSRIDRYLLKGRLLKHKYNEKQLLAIRNIIECEAHRELILRFSKDRIPSRRRNK